MDPRDTLDWWVVLFACALAMLAVCIATQGCSAVSPEWPECYSDPGYVYAVPGPSGWEECD